MQTPAVMEWTPIRQEGEERPSPRSAHTLVSNGEFAYLFGGCDKRRPPGPNNELYKLDMSDKSYFYWTKVHVEAGAPTPAPRWHPTAHMFKERTMLVFGGFSSNKVPMVPITKSRRARPGIWGCVHLRPRRST